MKTYIVSIIAASTKTGNATGGSYFIKAKDENDLVKKAAKKMATKIAGMTRRGVSFKPSDKSFNLFVEAKEDWVGPYNIIVKTKFNIV